MVQSYLQLIESKFKTNENTEDAYFMKKYLKNLFDSYGIKTPQRKELYKEVYRELGVPAKEYIFELVKELWNKPHRDFQYFGMEILKKYKKKEIEENFIDLYEYMIVNKSWWDTVDTIATNLVGDYIKLYPENKQEINQKYIESSNIWLNRTAILFQLKYKDKTDTELLFSNIQKCQFSKEFFIQKSIGWALREYSKTDPETVITFVNNNQLVSLSKREALRIIKK